ncbi:ATP-binding protein [Paenibacillus tarimensis]
MSIKLKLSLFISLIVAVVLTLNISFYYISSRNEMLANAEQQSEVIARQIGATVEVSEQAKRHIEDSLGSMLRMAAIAAKHQLPNDIDEVSNEQLADISEQLGIDHITLWKRTQDDIVALKSSEPDEINLSAKSWDYWYTAFNQLFDRVPVTVERGQKLPDYWSGPYNYATSNPNVINKWGDYYDGTTNYMINPYVNADILLDFERLAGTDALVGKLLKDNENVLEITGFDPEFFGKEPILKLKKGKLVYNLDVRAVTFGQYDYKNEADDMKQIVAAAETDNMTTIRAEINGTRVLKSFIPMTIGSNKTYVIGITMDRAFIDQMLYRQLLLHSLISFSLIVITLFSSYFISGILMRPINHVLLKVNEIAAGNFGERITVANPKDELGHLAGSVNSMSDNLNLYMNQLKESAEELRSTKEYLESFISHTSDAIFVTDLKGNLMQANKAFEFMYGWRYAEAQGQPLPMVPETHAEEAEQHVHSIMKGETIADYETIRRTKDGRMIDVSLTISPIRDGEGSIIAIASISRNITLRKQTEEIMRRSEKLSVVGQLAAGVAHEVRNPLTTLKGFLQLHKIKGTLTDEHLDVMMNELDHINFIVSEFLVLAKPQVQSIQPINIRELINNLMILLDSQATLAGIVVDTDFVDDIPNITGDSNQLKQVFVNIMKNAMEAMPHGGTIRIRVFRNDRYQVVIQFIDQGIGMTEEELLRIGEPFYTMKETGTGLGLMVCQQIMNHHKGHIHISSRPGTGTTVEVVFPSSA